jgi:hypothetical protein
VVVNLYASSDRVDTDFTAKLCDVYPDGRAMLICDGILRARHRLSMETEDFLVPGDVYSFAIDLWETAIAFNAGHRILVAISSSNHPRFDANPNTGDPFMQHETTLVATNAVYHDPAHPSHILLPVTGTLPSGVADSPDIARRPGIQLLANGPNPFRHSTRVRFRLGSPANTSLAVYDVTGRAVRHIAGGRKARGEYTLIWDSRDDGGRSVSAGLYYWVLRAGDSAMRGPVVVVR